MKSKRKAAHVAVYVLVFLLVLTLLLVPSLKQGDAEVVSAPPPRPLVPRDSLRIITPELIEDAGLTIDWGLQEYIANTLERYQVGFAAVTVLDPRTGEILALYGRDSSGEDCRLGLNAYLAASLFKLVTATAAIDYAGMSADTPCTYTGRAHTLYRSQLFSENRRWERTISLARAFASSNNVVFGKLGACELGVEPLLLAAMRLGFWQQPMMDCESSPSTLFFPDDDYRLAELASGFNRETRVSPVHAAQIAGAGLNGGTMVSPRILRSSPVAVRRVLSPDTARNLEAMMLQTVKSGTVSGAFRSARHDRVLRSLSIGAKSGTIKGTSPDGKRIWFMGFAQDPGTGEAISIGCLIIRGDYYRIQSDDLAKRIIRFHFSRPVSVASRTVDNAVSGSEQAAF